MSALHRGLGLSVLFCVCAAAAGGGQDNPSRSFGPGRCGPADPSYIRVAGATGGQPYFLSPSELAQSAVIMADLARDDRELLLWASAAAAGRPQVFTVPVDPSVSRLVVSASFDTPGGALAVAGPERTAPNAQHTTFACSRIVALDGPRPGTYRIELHAAGRFWLTVRAQTPVSLGSAVFVREDGRPGHEGLFPIHGRPVAGRAATLRVRVAAEGVTDAAFALVSTEGRQLQPLELQAVDDEEYVGPVVPPDGDFRVMFSGSDAAGFAFQRLVAMEFGGELVEVVPAEPAPTASAGESVAVPFVVRNHGPRARFRIVAVAGATVVEQVRPSLVALEPGAEATVTVPVTIPGDIRTGSSLEVTVTATSEGAGDTWNSARLRLRLRRGRP